MKVLVPYLGGPCFRSQVMKTTCWDHGWLGRKGFQDFSLEKYGTCGWECLVS